MAAVALASASLKISLNVVQPPSNPLSSTKVSSTLKQETTYAAGVAAGQVNRGAPKQYTIAASTKLTIDLNDGTQIDLNGDAITFARLRGIVVQHDAASLNTASTVKLDGRASVSGTITGATNASPIVVTSAAHLLTTGDSVVIAGVGGNTAANGTFTITRVGADTFSLDGSTGNSSYTSGGTWTHTRNVISDLTATLAAGEIVALDRPAGNGMVLTNATADKLVITNSDTVNAALVNVGLIGGAT